MTKRKGLRPFLPYGRQDINDEDIRAVVEVLKGDWLTQGPSIEQFEKSVADYIGVKHAVAFSNGTAALHAAYSAAGIGRGDVVLTSPMTFLATSNAALFTGAEVRFADIDEKTFCLDPEKAKAALSPDVRAIAPVSFAGYPADISAFKEIAEKQGAVVIEDACHALGGERDGRKIGRDADMTVFSFHPVKHITTGEGGMVVTDQEDFADKLRLFRAHGIVRDPGKMKQEYEGPWYYEMQALGYNYRLTDIQCALGRNQLRRLDAFLDRRRRLVRLYDELFSQVPDVKVPPSHPGHAWHLYPLRVPAERRKEIFEAFRAESVGVQVHYLPVHLHPFYRERYGFAPGAFPVAERMYAEEISIPMFGVMEEEETFEVLEVLLDALYGDSASRPKIDREACREKAFRG